MLVRYTEVVNTPVGISSDHEMTRIVAFIQRNRRHSVDAMVDGWLRWKISYYYEEEYGSHSKDYQTMSRRTFEILMENADELSVLLSKRMETIEWEAVNKQNGGTRDYVTPEEDIEIVTSRFFRKVSRPVLTDVKPELGGGVYDVYPREIGDLFAGEQVVLFGRYREAGPRTIALTGTLGDEAQRRSLAARGPSTTAKLTPECVGKALEALYGQAARAR